VIVQNKHSGFTLIELSIVLIIISLIVGGIIGGKGLMKSAEIKHAISNIASIKTAINTFQDQYDSLPGDMIDATSYWANTNNGNGNGKYPHTDDPEDGEGGYIWHHLGLSEIYHSYTRPGGADFSYEYGESTPEILPKTAAVAQYREYAHSHNRYDTMKNYIQIGKWDLTGTGSEILCEAADSKTASIIDKKIDDGNASSGAVFAFGVSPNCPNAVVSCTDWAGGGLDYQQPRGTVNYNLSSADGKCRMAFKLFND